MKQKYLFGLLIILAIGIWSCKKDDNMVHARIIDTQDITYLGCGYLLQLDDSSLIKPIYLPSAFQHDGIEVEVSYKHTTILDTCQYGSVIYDMVNINDIKLAQ